MYSVLLAILLSTQANAADCLSLTRTPVVATFSDVAIGQRVYPVRHGQWTDLHNDLIECGAHDSAKYLRRWMIERKIAAWSLLGGYYTAPATVGLAVASRLSRNDFRRSLLAWDGDGDSVEPDQCPDTPEDKDGYEDIDGCPELDNDGDGIIDTSDKCPNHPEDFDAYQDKDGCPDIDRDGDSLIDILDQCPDDPEVINGYLDDDGCPDER